MVQLRAPELGGYDLIQSYVKAAVTTAVIFGVMMALTPSGERVATGGVVGPLLAAFMVLQASSARRFVLRHRRGAIVLGTVTIGIGLFVLFSSVSSPTFDPKAAGTATGLLMLVGAFVLILPFTVQLMESLVPVANAEPPLSAAKRPRGAFRPMGEAGAALAHLSDHRGALLRVVGPWFLVCCALPTLVIMADWKSFAERGVGSALMVLLGLNLLVLAELALLCVAMIQWTRFTAIGQEPRLTDFPGRALWGWAWRGLICAPLLGFLAQVELLAETHMPAAPQWQFDGLVGLVGFSMLVLLSPLAFVLPAVALDVPDKGIAASQGGFRLTGRKFYLGAAAILAPYALATWGLDLLHDEATTPTATAAIGYTAISTLLLFGTAVVATTYLTQIYVRGASILATHEA